MPAVTGGSTVTPGSAATAATGSTAAQTTAQPAARAELARTGVSDVAGAVALAALALVGGATLLVLRRRA
ncbi:hypothetical protein CXF47_07180 [Corynebacterium bovis]|nr:hypothetical protein CXF47_07180 [Corynebacterium bovis]